MNYIRPFINNQFLKTNHLFFKVLPLTLEKQQVHAVTISQTHDAIKSAYNAYANYRYTTQYQKQGYLNALYDNMKANTNEFASIIREETGKPWKEAIGEVEYSLSYIQYYANEAIRMNGELIPSPVAHQEIKITRHPVGVAVLITPWNFPLAMVVRKVAAALACGCSVIIKPASETTNTSCRLAKSCLDINLPPGLLNVLPIKTNELKDHVQLLTSDDRIAKFSITGSTEAGISLYQESAKYMKRVSMELGGNAAFIVFKDADLSKVVQGLKVGKLRNTGQTCVSVNRIFVHSSIKEQFIKQTIDLLKNATVNVDFGPLISDKALYKTTDLVNRAVQDGAKILFKKELDAPNHLYYPPTLLEISKELGIYHQEVFSPIVCFLTFEDVQQVIDMANDTPYGLSNYIYTTNMDVIQKCRQEIETGMLGINTCSISQAGVPFGGIKNSGFGREGGQHGLEEYSYLKYSNQQY